MVHMLEETACHVGHLDLLTDAITKQNPGLIAQSQRRLDGPIQTDDWSEQLPPTGRVVQAANHLPPAAVCQQERTPGT
jgi:hypothetical protein